MCNICFSWSWYRVPLLDRQKFQRFNPGLSWNTPIPRWDIGGGIWANLRLWPTLGIYEPILLWCSSSNQLIKPQYEQFCKSSGAHGVHLLGKPVDTKTDEFPENFRTASDPPPPLFRKKILRFFPQTVAPALDLEWNFSDRKWPPPFSKLFPEIHDQNCLF